MICHAPCAGARIETCGARELAASDLMPPVRGRELKLHTRILSIIALPDAPCAGARIETLFITGRTECRFRCPLCGGEN